MPAHALLAEEVADLNGLPGDGDVDGEMGVTEAHLVQVTLGDTRDHVLHVRADGADARKLGVRGVSFEARTTGGEARGGGLIGGAFSKRRTM